VQFSGVEQQINTNGSLSQLISLTQSGQMLQGSSMVGKTVQFTSGQMPAVLDGVSVTVNGKAAYVYYISPGQINVQAPSDAATGAVSVVVTNNGTVSAQATAQLQTFAPACFCPTVRTSG